MKIIERVLNHKHFYGTNVSLNLGALCVGLAMGWPRWWFGYLYGGIVPALDASWAEAAINVGASVGGLLSILVSELFGRRISFALSAVILLVFWGSFGATSTYNLFIISAAGLGGVGVGLFSASAVLYVAEVSPPDSRGFLGILTLFFGYLGSFAMNLLGYLVENSILMGTMISLPMVFLATIYFWMIESPMYLFQHGSILKAKIALKKLRDVKNVTEIDEEYRSMVDFFNKSLSQESGQVLLVFMCPRRLRTMTLVIVPMVCVSQMLGLIAISEYAESLIEIIVPDTGKIITSFVDLVSMILCMFVVERLGRKPLLAITIIGSGLCCLTLAVYTFVTEEKCRTVQFVPVMVLCLYYTIHAFGLIPVLPIITSEIFPGRVKTMAVGLYTALIYLITFCMQRSYVILYKRTNSCLAFAYFTIVGSIGLPFALILLPETKGKSLLQIQNELQSVIVVNY